MSIRKISLVKRKLSTSHHNEIVIVCMYIYENGDNERKEALQKNECGNGMDYDNCNVAEYSHY